MSDVFERLERLVSKAQNERHENVIADIFDVLLTPREKDVVRSLGKAETAAEIGRLLNISADAVKRHLVHMYKKLCIRNRTELTILAVYAGYVRYSHVELDVFKIIVQEIERQRSIANRKRKPK